MIGKGAVVAFAVIAAGAALAQPPSPRAESPAASPVPETLREQSYDAGLVETGRAISTGEYGGISGFSHVMGQLEVSFKNRSLDVRCFSISLLYSVDPGVYRFNIS